MKTRLFLLLIALILLGILGYSLFGRLMGGGGGGFGAPMGDFAMPVETAMVESRTISEKVEAVGTLEAIEGVTLRPEVAGTVVALPFAEGTLVRQGDVLVQLDPRTLQAALKEAEAARDLSRLSFKRIQQLREQGFSTAQRFDEAQAELRVNEARVASAKAALDKLTIRAPFEGVVGLRRISIGDYVAPGQDLVPIQAVNPMRVEFTLPERYAQAVQPGQTVAVTIDQVPPLQVTATISARDSVITKGERAIYIRAEIPNPDGQLKPGAFARVTWEWNERPSALFVPEQAVVPFGGRNMVYKVVASGEKNIATPVDVTLGLRQPGVVEVVNGLAANEVVIISGQMKVQPGAAVMSLNQQPSAPPAASPAPAAAAPAATPAPTPEPSPATETRPPTPTH